MMQAKTLRVLMAAIGMAAFGCNGEDQVGDSASGGSGGNAGAGGAQTSSSGAAGESTLGADIDDFVGNWDGYIDGLDFLDGTSRLRFALPAAGNGTLVFGESDPPVVENPDVFPFLDSEGQPLLGSQFLIPGYQYSGLVMLQDRHLHLSTDRNAPLRDFCEIQEPVPDTVNAGEFKCIRTPPCTMEGPDGCALQDENCMNPEPVDCGKLKACLLAGCDCEENGCTTEPFVDGVFELWLEDADTLVGEGLMRADGNGWSQVRLSRIP